MTRLDNFLQVKDTEKCLVVYPDGRKLYGFWYQDHILETYKDVKEGKAKLYQ